jgi:flagellar basal-body rod protein FlgG
MGASDIAGAIISRAVERAEVAAQNMANMTTPGYKARLPFHRFVSGDPLNSLDSLGATIPAELSVDLTGGKLRSTGAPLDLAISGSGFFAVQSKGVTFYTRNGQFHRDADGRVITASGAVLQTFSGDLVASDGAITVLSDGTVLANGEPAGQLRIVDFANASVLKPLPSGLFEAKEGAGHDMSTPAIHQGMLEEANVSTAAEMLSLMAALRSAEAGQRTFQTFDDLIGQAVTAFGQT